MDEGRIGADVESVAINEEEAVVDMVVLAAEVVVLDAIAIEGKIVDVNTYVQT